MFPILCTKRRSSLCFSFLDLFFAVLTNSCSYVLPIPTYRTALFSRLFAPASPLTLNYPVLVICTKLHSLSSYCPKITLSVPSFSAACIGLCSLCARELRPDLQIQCRYYICLFGSCGCFSATEPAMMIYLCSFLLFLKKSKVSRITVPHFFLLLTFRLSPQELILYWLLTLWAFPSSSDAPLISFSTNALIVQLKKCSAGMDRSASKISERNVGRMYAEWSI
ncbi:hypothetical protein DFS34DRAFT_640173 [Phlyctochytrium arcticum]|nr:hypothetical protein DFS34DRAFT_640173 [Phlyctochytrium arcticum]